MAVNTACLSGLLRMKLIQVPTCKVPKSLFIQVSTPPISPWGRHGDGSSVGVRMPAPWTGEALEQPGTKRDSQWVLVNASRGALLAEGTPFNPGTRWYRLGCWGVSWQG